MNERHTAESEEPRAPGAATERPDGPPSAPHHSSSIIHHPSFRRSKWVYVVSVSVLLAGAALALTLMAPSRGPVAAADALRRAGRYPEALVRYQDLLARRPDDPEALWGVALTHLARRDPALALQYLNRYLRKHPRGRHAEEARQAVDDQRAAYIASQRPSPELAPGPPPEPPPPPESPPEPGRAPPPERPEELWPPAPEAREPPEAPEPPEPLPAPEPAPIR